MKYILYCFIILSKDSRNLFKYLFLFQRFVLTDLYDIDAIPRNVSLTELGMDSMIVVEVIHTLEKNFDTSLTAQDVRNLNFAKLREMEDKRLNK